MNNLKGKIAVVTGGSRGIGRAIVQMLLQQGCQVAFNYLQNQEEAFALEREASKVEGICKAAQVDIKDFEAVKLWFEEIKKDFGGLDILVNNAGIIADKALMMMSQDDWNRVIQTNLNGVFHASRASIVHFLKQKQGNMINISSVSGVMGLAGQTNYSAAKGGINAFTKALAKEVAGYGIRVNAVAPGFIETDMLARFNEQQKEEISSTIPVGRLGSSEDVANCVEFLLSPHSHYMTGQIIHVDGGLAMR